mmetsp:Transcript_69292/g.129406  ORF Transcript_69292/g.129406 Transcript_69292/m.129406 type:complete len:575 (-) Transcript_69292:52-1776(-)
MGCAKSIQASSAPQPAASAPSQGTKPPPAPPPAQPPQPAEKPVATQIGKASESPAQGNNVKQPQPVLPPVGTIKDNGGTEEAPRFEPSGEDTSLDWVSAAPPTGSEGKVVLPTWSPSAVTVKVWLDDRWADMDSATVAAIVAQIGKINADEISLATPFRVRARGQEYEINLEELKQKNCSTGKVRDIRIVEVYEPTVDGHDSAAEVTDPARSKEVPDGPPDASELPPPEDIKDPFLEQQREYGPQSRRGGVDDTALLRLEANMPKEEGNHFIQVFADMAVRERSMCADWAVFYHSYSYAALIYEVNAAVGAVLFRYRSRYAPLPRLLVHEFANMPDAETLLRKFNDKWASNNRDHDPGYRTVAVSVMCSLYAKGPEASPPVVFTEGYSCKDLSFRKVLDKLLESCYVPKGKIKSVGDSVIRLAETHGLDVSQFGGKACKSGKPGHLLQIFIRRSLVDTLVYAAKPYGYVDEERMPMSEWINSNGKKDFGQARILCHPKYFLRANSVRQFIASSDPTFHNSRQAFQAELTGLLKDILGQANLREKAAKGIYGGALPHWWTAEDQRLKAGPATSAG